MQKSGKDVKTDFKVMSYLSLKSFNSIGKRLISLSISRISQSELKKFDCGIDEYNIFLQKEALKLEEKCISKTFVLKDYKFNIIIGYFTLSTTAIKLTEEEKISADLKESIFDTFPAIKLGKLAINKNIPDEIKMKGYGSFVLDIIDSFVYKIVNIGVGCRFIIVDADIEYNHDTDKFYLKNGFKYNNKYRKGDKTISMRRDIFRNN